MEEFGPVETSSEVSISPQAEINASREERKRQKAAEKAAKKAKAAEKASDPKFAAKPKTTTRKVWRRENFVRAEARSKGLTARELLATRPHMSGMDAVLGSKKTRKRYQLARRGLEEGTDAGIDEIYPRSWILGVRR
jgi:sRNA-binding protein